MKMRKIKTDRFPKLPKDGLIKEPYWLRCMKEEYPEQYKEYMKKLEKSGNS